MGENVAQLARLGWDERWAQAAHAADPAGELAAVRVASEHRGAYHVAGEAGTAWAELTGRSYHDARDKRALPTVGDWVLVARWADALAARGAAVIRAVLPRRGLLVRRAAGEATAPQPLAANVDVGLVMTSANKDLSPARLDRYLALLRGGGIAPALVLSKVDLAGDAATTLAQLAELGAPVLAVSAATGAGLPEVRALAGTGRTCALLGSSGVGKSTLLNALVAEAGQLTQPIRRDERGRHTTTRRELFVTDGGLWIDTPGMRELARWLDLDDDADAFEDIVALAARCRFRDCHHRDEPGCAVRGAVDAARLASFHKLAAEREIGARDQKAARRIAETRQAKAKRYAPRRGKS
ncbi:MAG TPA: ribosome small subunit-dependent GTPase A [Kofleriaceae bacterium]|jgi:ribosome biogenesis GTPase